MTSTCPHGHYRHTHIWMMGYEDPMWRGVTRPRPGSELDGYEPCPETDPGHAMGEPYLVAEPDRATGENP
jgi:hypothetical protein